MTLTDLGETGYFCRDYLNSICRDSIFQSSQPPFPSHFRDCSKQISPCKVLQTDPSEPTSLLKLAVFLFWKVPKKSQLHRLVWVTWANWFSLNAWLEKSIWLIKEEDHFGTLKSSNSHLSLKMWLGTQLLFGRTSTRIFTWVPNFHIKQFFLSF